MLLLMHLVDLLSESDSLGVESPAPGLRNELGFGGGEGSAPGRCRLDGKPEKIHRATSRE